MCFLHDLSHYHMTNTCAKITKKKKFLFYQHPADNKNNIMIADFYMDLEILYFH